MGLPKLQYSDSVRLAEFREQGEYQSRRTVDIAELKQLIAEGHFEHYSHPYGWDVLFELYRWMVWSAKKLGPTEKTRWGTASAFADVGDYHSVLEFPGPRSFGAEWQTDLVWRLRFALWDGGHLVSEWRRRAKLDPPGKLVLTGPFAKGGAVDLELRMLFWCAHPYKRLNVALNHCHPGARQPADVRLCPGKDRWNAVLSYGYDSTPSSWSVECPQTAGEPFAEYIRRASGLFESLMVACERPATSAAPACSGRPRYPVGEEGCGYPAAPPLEEDFALVSVRGDVSVVRAASAGEAWRKGAKVLYGRGGNAWKWTRGKVCVDYESDIGLQEAAELFAKAPKTQEQELI